MTVPPLHNSPINTDVFTRSGRAVAFPVYKGTFERRLQRGAEVADHAALVRSALWRDLAINWYKDLARTLDYLQTRPDIDAGKLAYFGLSWGAVMAPVNGALESRLKVFVLEGGGLDEPSLPEVDQVNFAPRHTAPTLMLNGLYDLNFPAETNARLYLNLLGTPLKDKKLVFLDGGHIPLLDSRIMKEMLDWLDRYLGSVK